MKGAMKQKSKIIISGIVLGETILTGCTQNTIQNQNQEQTMEQQQSEFAQIAEAIKNGQGAHCVITQTIDDQEQKMEYWIKDNKFKVIGLAPEDAQGPQFGQMISDGEYTYMWGDDKDGLKWKIEEDELSEDNQYEPEMPDFSDQEELNMYQEKGFHVNCEKVKLGDDDFTPPANVQFQSMEMMMENAFGQMRQEMIQTQEQEDFGDEDMDQEEVMQQYQLMMQQMPDGE